MFKKIASAAVLFVLAFFLVSCSGNNAEKREIVMWTDMTEAASLKNAAVRFEEKYNCPVRIVRVPFEELPAKYRVATPVRKGPDIITGPHDWIGQFATAELISPIDISNRHEFMDVPLKTLSFNGRLYGLPISVETLGLIYNKKFIKTPPQTMEELIAISEHTNKGTIETLRGRTSAAGNRYDDMLRYEAFRGENGLQGFLYEIEDFYFSWAFLGGYGAYIFGEKNGALDISDVGLSNEGAVEGAGFILSLKDKYQLIPDGMTKDTANSRFMDNKLLFTINGPWSLVDFKKLKIDYGFAPIPKLDNGSYPSPFVGVQGIYLNNYSSKKDLAIKFIEELSSTEGQIEIYLEGGRVPSRYDALEDRRISEKTFLTEANGANPGFSSFTFLPSVATEKNDELKGILDAAEHGTPMPNIPELNAVWQPMKEAMQLIMRGQINAQDALAEATQRIDSDIERMRE